MIRRILPLLMLALLGAADPRVDWLMVGRDALHSSTVSEGPPPPLIRVWIAKSEDKESSFTTWPVVMSGTVYSSSGPGVLAVSAEDGKQRWFASPIEGQKHVAPALDETAVYIPLPFGTVAALDRRTGAELWKVKVGEGSLNDPSATLAEGRLFFGLTDEKAFYAIDVTDGSVIWKSPTDFEPDSIPAVVEGIVVFTTEDIGSRRVSVFALEASTGREIWRTEQREANSSPSILDGKVILGGGDFFAYALDLRTGKEIWKSPVEDKFSVRNMPAIAFGDVFLADRIGNIYRLDGETGKRKWIFRDTEGTMDQSFPVIAGKTLFIGSSAGNLYALDTDSGRLLWQDHVNGIVLSGAADSERFYFGVKFGDEGLYAYEHDPEGELEPALGTLRNLRALIGGVVLFALIFVGVVLYARRRRRGASESAA